MVQVSYPGVYIEEMPSGVRTITGVATSIAAFVGYTSKGVPDKAVAITSYADFERQYGGLDRDSNVSYGVRQFFANGGTQALIVRVASGYASAAWALQDGAGAALDVKASSPGMWGNSLGLSVEQTSARNPDAEFNLIVSQLQSDGTTFVPVETHRNLNMDQKSANFVESVVNNASAVIQITRRAGLTFSNSGFAVSGAIAFPLNPSNSTIGGTIDGKNSFLLTASGAPWAAMSDLLTAVNNTITTAGLGAALTAAESGIDGAAGTGSLKLTSGTPGESSCVVIAGGAFGGLAATIKIGLANGGREVTGNAEHRPSVVSNVLPSTSGVDGSKGGAMSLVGSQANKTGMYALLDTDQFNILLIPETGDLADPNAASAVISAGAALSEARRAFYIVDAPVGATLSTIETWLGIVSPSGNTARNAATYFPSVRIPDPLDDFRLRSMSPSGTMAGIYARTDASRGVWKAPAGTDATLNGVVELNQPINDLENGPLNQKGVNVLRSFPAYGRVAWGARTMKGSDAQADEYKYIPIRRLALFLEESLYRGTQWVVFEPNDEPLWAQIRLNIGAFMQGLFRQGAFQGQTPRDAYFVKCDKETTTQNDINLGIVNIVVGFAPLKPAEFVVIQLQQIAGQIQT